jgi:hypothetical protein
MPLADDFNKLKNVDMLKTMSTITVQMKFKAKFKLGNIEYNLSPTGGNEGWYQCHIYVNSGINKNKLWSKIRSCSFSNDPYIHDGYIGKPDGSTTGVNFTTNDIISIISQLEKEVKNENETFLSYY